MKRAIVSVINDLVTDQRVHKSCLVLQSLGFEVLLVGRQKRGSPPMDQRPYPYHRMQLFFEKGPFFYAEYNIRLLFYLLFQPASLYFSNDLDTLLPNFIVSRLRRQRLIYDSHEYFTETPELVHRKFVQKVWKTIEGMLLPRLGSIITVNESIAALFREKYHINVQVIRNIPPRFHLQTKADRQTLGLDLNKKILLMQGAGINMQRGAEELVQAMQYLPDCHLLLIGGGDVWNELQRMAAQLQVADRIQFLGRMPYQQMMAYTAVADLGLSLDKPTNINYRLSLPNKLFDYIQAGIPVLCSRLPELEKIISEYQLGDFIADHNPQQIAESIRSLVSDEQKLKSFKNNALKAATQLNWENEQKKLQTFIAFQHG